MNNFKNRRNKCLKQDFKDKIDKRPYRDKVGHWERIADSEFQIIKEAKESGFKVNTREMNPTIETNSKEEVKNVKIMWIMKKSLPRYHHLKIFDRK